MSKSKFSRVPEMKTNEFSIDEVGKGMKRGGHAHHYAIGGPVQSGPMGGMGQHPMYNPQGGFGGNMGYGFHPQVGMGNQQPMYNPQNTLPTTSPSAAQNLSGTSINPNMSAGLGQALKKGGKVRYAKGGEVESAAMERKEEREIKSVKKELKKHEGEKASKAHHGLKAGGRAPKAGPNVMGGLAGGISATRAQKKGTEGVEEPGYKHGGKVHHVSGHPEGSHEHHKAMAKHHAAKYKEGGSAHHAKMHEHHKHEAKMCMGGKMHKKDGGAAIDRFETKTTLKPKINIKDKVVGAKQTKSFNTETEGLEGKGYKRGGALKKFAKGGTVSQGVAKRYLSDMANGEHMPTKKAGTKSIHQDPAGYKKGGHVKHKAAGGFIPHHTTYGHSDAGHAHMHEKSAKMAFGHDELDGHPMKKGGKVKHKKTGGKCNY